MDNASATLEHGREGPSSNKRILRQSTFVFPSTGERLKRNFSLGDATAWKHDVRDVAADNDGDGDDDDNDDDDDETAPFLPGRHGAAPRSRRRDNFFWRGVSRVEQHARGLYRFATSKMGQNIFKCSLAYLLGSMGTFVLPISRHLGKQDSKHMVATVTVYFHPARSLGSMHQATIVACLGFCYAAFISFTSMAVSMVFGRLDLLYLGHGIVLVVFCGAGLGAIAWLKQHLDHPLVNVACSLASLGCITVLVKEGSVQAGTFSEHTVLGVLLMVLAGMLCTTFVNVAVLPRRARTELCKDLTKNTDLLGELLVAITRAFLSGCETDLEDESFKKLNSEHQSSLNSMRKNLVEAKFEHWAMGTEKQYVIEKRLVQCLSRLSQNVGGLRSAAFSQFTLLKDVHHLGTVQQRLTARSTPDMSQLLNTTTSSSVVLDPIPEATEDDNYISDRNSSKPTSRRVSMSADPGQLFETFIDQVGPPTKSLVYTMKQILDVLPFADDRPFSVAVDDQFHNSLEDAINLYKDSRRQALEILYQNRAFHASRSVHSLADVEEVSASCGHFSFALLDFAEDMLEYLDILDELKCETEARPRQRSWRWVMFWRKPIADVKVEPLIAGFHEDGMIGKDIPQPIKAADDFANSAKYSKEIPWSYSLWKRLSFLRRDDIRFAIKVGVGAALYALPAFLETTRPIFHQWRGEWGLVSYMVVCSMTIGASNTTSMSRIIGTLIGALLAIVAWLISNHDGIANPWLLAFFGWLVALGSSYIILAKGNGPFGRFIMLTYNLGALYAYSLSVRDDDNDDDEGGIDPAIWEIVGHRVVSVIAGCVWAIFITRVIWPISARRKLKNGICILWLRMGLIWKRDPLAMFLLGEPKSSYMDIREEAALQSFLAYLKSLKNAASSEYELRGPFPDKVIGRILERTARMLDAFHALNIVISKDMKASSGEAAILRYTRHDRIALSSRISHLFSVLASSMKLEYPLNDVLPNVENSRDRLLARTFEFRRSGEGRETVQEQDYQLIYAYALVTGQLAHDIQAVSNELETLYGTLNEEDLKLQ